MRSGVTLLAVLIELALVELHGPTGQRIFVNPHEVTSVREPQARDHFAKGTHCLPRLHPNHEEKRIWPQYPSPYPAFLPSRPGAPSTVFSPAS